MNRNIIDSTIDSFKKLSIVNLLIILQRYVIHTVKLGEISMCVVWHVFVKNLCRAMKLLMAKRSRHVKAFILPFEVHLAAFSLAGLARMLKCAAKQNASILQVCKATVMVCCYARL